jgi:hypothetical protein
VIPLHDVSRDAVRAFRNLDLDLDLDRDPDRDRDRTTSGVP